MGNFRPEVKHMFASAWQDGINHLNPKYLRRDTLFTDKVMELHDKALQLAVINAKESSFMQIREILGALDDNYGEFDAIDDIETLVTKKLIELRAQKQSI